MIKEHSLVVGIPGIEATPERLDYLCKTYGQYIDSFYTSPPFGQYYSWKGDSIPFKFTYENCLLLKNQIDVIRSHNISIRMVLNDPWQINTHASQDVSRFCEMFGRPDYIVTVDSFIPEFVQNFDIPLAYSCMNAIYKNGFENLKKCDVVVLNSEHNYNLSLMKQLKGMGKDIEIIVNNSCSFWCAKQCDDTCTNLETKLINTVGIERTLALQAIFPCELSLYGNYVDLYKISNRPSTFTRTEATIKRWIECPSLEQLRPQLKTVYDYTLQYNMAAFRTDEHLEKPVNFDKVIDIKNEIWSKKLGRNIDIRNL